MKLPLLSGKEVLAALTSHKIRPSLNSMECTTDRAIFVIIRRVR
jgi:hypothetical protein